MSRTVLLLAAWLVIAACSREVRIARAPIAFAGFDRHQRVGEEVVLDASLSMDPDGDVLAFTWRLASVPDGSTAALDTMFGPIVRFVPQHPGIYVAALTAADDHTLARDLVAVTVTPVDTSTETVELTIEPTVCQGSLGRFDTTDCGAAPDTVSLRATATNAERVEWQFVRLPTGTSVDDLNVETTALGPLEFDPPRPGDYWVTATARRGALASRPAFAAIGAFRDADGRPLARIDAPPKVSRGAVVLFDGRASQVATATTVVYDWSSIVDPSGGRDRLTDTQTGCPPDRCRRLVPSATGTYIVSLRITAGALEGVTAVAAVEVQ